MLKRIKRKKLILLVVLLFLIILLGDSYSKYFSSVKVNVSSTTGEMICNIKVDTSDTYIENNLAYFRVKVSNNDSGKVTATDVDYKLIISNEAGSNGIFYYIDSLGNTSSDSEEYVESLTTPTYSFGKEAETMEFKVFVKVPSGLKETVNFIVDLEAVQKEME